MLGAMSQIEFVILLIKYIKQIKVTSFVLCFKWIARWQIIIIYLLLYYLVLNIWNAICKSTAVDIYIYTFCWKFTLNSGMFVYCALINLITNMFMMGYRCISTLYRSNSNWRTMFHQLYIEHGHNYKVVTLNIIRWPILNCRQKMSFWFMQEKVPLYIMQNITVRYIYIYKINNKFYLFYCICQMTCV